MLRRIATRVLVGVAVSLSLTGIYVLGRLISDELGIR